MQKYNITQNHDSTKNAFSQWAQYDKPQRRGGRPTLAARAFRVDKDPWRQLWRTGFGFDYLRYFKPEHMRDHAPESATDFKLTELNKWEETGDGNAYPMHGYDVYVQRLSIYVQRNMSRMGLAQDDWQDMPNPYLRKMSVPGTLTQNGDMEQRRSTIKSVVDSFDNSELDRIMAREMLTSRQTRLSSFLKRAILACWMTR
jgi:hypothetical protein